MTPAELLAHDDNGQLWPVTVGETWSAAFDSPLTPLQVEFS